LPKSTLGRACCSATTQQINDPFEIDKVKDDGIGFDVKQ
jgi:hypothetical protein